MSSTLDIKDDKADNVLVVTLTGSLDGHTTPQLESFLKGKLEAGLNRMVVVLKDVGYIASAGVGVLINFMKQCKAAAGAFEIAEPSGSVNEVLEILGLDALMTLHPDCNQAIHAAQNPTPDDD